MTLLQEGRLEFDFSTTDATKYDDWVFYRTQLTNAFGGAKGVDLIALDQSVSWLIEVKDYRRDRRTKPTELALEVAHKVRDTLAGLAAAQKNSNIPEERQFATKCLKKPLRVVLHLEQPATGSRLLPRIAEPTNLVQKLKQLLKAVDAHPQVVDQNSLTQNMTWTVRNLP